eukprot:gene3502-3771_t
MAIQLKKAGFHDFTVFEAADDIGGTWRDNTYPGCACDVASVLYCYSFEPYPFKEYYSGQKEINQYLHLCADKHNLQPHLQLSTRVTGATLDEASGTWTLTTSSGRQHTVRVLVLAVGGLIIPSLPAIPGLDSFPGAVFHTARWDHSVELQGKRVAVVGTGASAIQVIPNIQPTAGKLAVFQRTPAWVLPLATRRPKWLKVAASSSRWYNWLQRQRMFWTLELLLGTTLINNRKFFIRQVEKLCRAHIRQQVKDPSVQEALTPQYSLGCKRILGSDTYYPALCADNVQLITSGVREVKGNTIIAEDGSTVEADVIVFATGFDLSAVYHGLAIKGRAGADFDQQLTEEREEYLGLAAHNFPNLFTINGLNTGLGHNSLIFMTECAVNFIVKVVKNMQANKLRLVEVKQAAQHSFTEEVQQRLKGSVWLSGGCKSWYQSKDGENSVVLWPGLCVEYWWRTLWPRTADWQVETFDSSERQQKQRGNSPRAPTAVVLPTPLTHPGTSSKAKEH